MKVSVKMVSMEFVGKVRRGAKRMTIRPARKVPHEIGDILDLRHWSGRPYRSKQVHIGFARVIAYYPIMIRREGFEMDSVFSPRPKDLERLAKLDGFASWTAMIRWFEARYDLPLHGFVTEWKPIRTKVHACGITAWSNGTKTAVAKLIRKATLAAIMGAI